jgi:hypothetical protein
VRRSALSIFLFLGIALVVRPARAEGLGQSGLRFYYFDNAGHRTSARILQHYWRERIAHPVAPLDAKIDPKLRRAATIAEERANAHSQLRCWHYVKEALLAAGAVNSYPRTVYASEAGAELVHDYGFKRLSIHDPYSAPIGAILVYGNKNWGHVEIRTRDGFVSDYHSKDAYFFPLVAVYAKYSS